MAVEHPFFLLALFQILHLVISGYLVDASADPNAQTLCQRLQTERIVMSRKRLRQGVTFMLGSGNEVGRFG
jgi:hypothetical protein